MTINNVDDELADGGKQIVRQAIDGAPTGETMGVFC